MGAAKSSSCRVKKGWAAAESLALRFKKAKG